MKYIIIIEATNKIESCEDCGIYGEDGYGNVTCAITGEDIDTDKKPYNCPLIEVKDSIEAVKVKDSIEDIKVKDSIEDVKVRAKDCLECKYLNSIPKNGPCNTCDNEYSEWESN